MAQIDDFFMYENRVEGITDADYQRAQPYVEAAQAFAQTTYQSIYIIDYYSKNFLYVSDNPLFLCGHTADEVRQMGYGFYLSHVPEDEVPMLTELNRSGFRAFAMLSLRPRILAYLRENGRIDNVAELVRTMGVARTSVSRVLSALKREGVVARTMDGLELTKQQ